MNNKEKRRKEKTRQERMGGWMEREKCKGSKKNGEKIERRMARRKALKNRWISIY